MDSQASIAVLKAKIEPMPNAMQALTVVWDTMLNDVEEVAGDMQETQKVVAAYRAHTDRILALAVKGTKPIPEIE